MYANQHSDPNVSYNFGSAARQPRQVQIVGSNTLQRLVENVNDDYKQEVIENVGVQHPHLVYGTNSVSNAGTAVAGATMTTPGPTVQVVQSNSVVSPSNAVFNPSPPVVVPQGQTQNELEIEPIDLEEVQKIQARMPAADPTAPVGSNKNPIRIIQQGNQYITTQDVSDEHLQQIIQVLTNQALLSSSGSRPSAIYNRLTNRRIIFRVTRAKRRPDDGGASGSGTTSGNDPTKSTSRDAKKNHTGRSMGRKRKRRGSDEEDPDFEPEMPEEEVLPFPLIRRTSASGRVSKPPKHLVKDYKHLRLEDLTSKPDTSDEDDHSDGGYSDYINDGLSDEGWSEDGTNKNLRWPCPICTKVFSSRAGVARHRSIAHGPNSGRPRGRWANPYMASVRRRAKLKEAVSEATDDDLIEFVAPRLAKLVSPWDHLLMRSEQGNPPLPQVPRVVLDYLSLVERARAFLGDQLQAQPPSQKKSKKKQQQQQQEQGQSSKLQDSSNPNPDQNSTENAVSNAGDSSANPNADNTKSDANSTSVEPAAQNGQDEGQNNTVNGALEKQDPENTEQVNQAEGADDEEEEEEDEDEDDDSGAIIVKVDTQEQSAALGLACGKYIVREPLREEYLPRRFRSVLAAQRVGANSLVVDSSAIKTSLTQSHAQPKRAVVAMETAEDDEVDATLRSDVTSNDGSMQQFADASGSVANQSGDAQSQNMTMGVLVPEGGLGCPVPDEWIASGAFLTVLTETGQTSDLVIEAATGRWFHRPTGHLVSLTDGQAPQVQLEPDYQSESYEYPTNAATGSSAGSAGASTTPASSKSYTNKASASNSTEKRRSDTSKLGDSALRSQDQSQDQHQLTAEETAAQQEQILQQLAENGEVIDLNTLFPGVAVTEISPGVCLVTKPNGDRFNVEHGGEGITLETLQTILQMDA